MSLVHLTIYSCNVSAIQKQNQGQLSSMVKWRSNNLNYYNSHPYDIYHFKKQVYGSEIPQIWNENPKD